MCVCVCLHNDRYNMFYDSYGDKCTYEQIGLGTQINVVKGNFNAALEEIH